MRPLCPQVWPQDELRCPMSSKLKCSKRYPGVFTCSLKSRVDKKQDTHFYIRFRSNGKARKEMVGTQLRDGMTAYKASLIRSQRIQKTQINEDSNDNLKYLDNKVTTFDSLYFEYFKFKKSKYIKYDKYRYKKYIQNRFGSKQPELISLKELRDFKNEISIGLKPATIKHVLELLRRLSNFGVKYQMTKGLSFPVEMPPLNNRKTETLTEEELRRLLSAMDQDSDQNIAKIMKMALYTGMRKGEIFNLKWTDINFNNRLITIRNPKSGRDEHIPMNQSTFDLLKSHSVHELNPELVFPNKFGKKRVDIRKGVDRIKKRAGLPKEFRGMHGLRHVFASRLASSGKVDLYRIQKLLTHKSPQMTQRYAHLSNEVLREASEVMDDIGNNY